MSLGGRLVSIGSEAEADFLNRRFLLVDSSPSCWIGAFVGDELDPWEWSNGEDDALLLSRMSDAPKAMTESAEAGLAVVLAASEAASGGEDFYRARWISAPQSEAHCFLVEWEVVAEAERGLAARP